MFTAEAKIGDRVVVSTGNVVVHALKTDGTDAPPQTWCGRTTDDTWHIVNGLTHFFGGACLTCSTKEYDAAKDADL